MICIIPTTSKQSLVIITPNSQFSILNSQLDKLYGSFGYLLKSGLRFSRNALPPSCASSSI